MAKVKKNEDRASIRRKGSNGLQSAIEVFASKSYYEDIEFDLEALAQSLRSFVSIQPSIGLTQFENLYIAYVLSLYDSIPQAARKIGIAPSTVYRKKDGLLLREDANLRDAFSAFASGANHTSRLADIKNLFLLATMIENENSVKNTATVLKISQPTLYYIEDTDHELFFNAPLRGA